MLSNSKVFLVLAAVGAAVFANSLHNSFLIDDHAFFTGQRVTAAGLFSDFVPDVHMMTGSVDDGADIHYYRPLAHLVPMLSYLVFGNNVAGHHALNLLLWVLAAWMVFIFIEALFKDRILAFAVAFLYMVHPINGVLVNYITADVFSVQVILMIASLLFLLREKVAATFLTKGSCYLFFLLAMMCHETAMALPFYATAIFVAVRKQSWRQAFKKTQWLWLTLAVYFLWRLKFASLAGGIFGKFLSYHMNVLEYAATIGKLIVWYVSKLFWPVGIIMIKAQPVLRDGMGIVVWLAALAMLAGAWLWLVRKNRRAPAASMGLWWFALGFLPFCFATLFRPSMGMMIEPHWFIFPVIGFFLWLVSTVRALFSKKVAATFFWSAAGFLVAATFFMNTRWDGDLDYCRYWVAQSPGFSAPDFYLAMAYEENKDYDQARYWYNQVLAQGQYRPEMIYTALGFIDIMGNRLSDAKSDLNKALAIDPNMATAIGDLGIIAFTEKDYTQAQEYFLQAIALDRSALLPRLNLGKVLLKFGKTDEAIDAFEDALSIHPDSRAAMQELVLIGMSAQKNGDMKTATRVYDLLMKLAPNGLNDQ